MGETHFSPYSVALYGVVLLFSGIAYYILTQVLLTHHGKESTLAAAIGKDRKGIASLIIYSAAIPFAFIQEWVSYVAYITVAVMWLIPDRRIERAINK